MPVSTNSTGDASSTSPFVLVVILVVIVLLASLLARWAWRRFR